MPRFPTYFFDPALFPHKAPGLTAEPIFYKTTRAIHLRMALAPKLSDKSFLRSLDLGPSSLGRFTNLSFGRSTHRKFLLSRFSFSSLDLGPT